MGRFARLRSWWPRRPKARPDSSSVYLGAVASRDLVSEPSSNDTATFAAQHYQEINRARLEHLARLDLPLDRKRVVEIGSGPGDLTSFFLDRACTMLSVDGREENLVELRRRYPQVETALGNIETLDLTPFGMFEVCFLYGLLYHLENPAAALRNVVPVTTEMILLETMVTDSRRPINQIVDERLIASQALFGIGSRPSPSYVATVLDRLGMNYVYLADPPEHPHYRFRWNDDLSWHRDGHPLRCVFVASRSPIDHEKLSNLLTRS